MHAFEAHILFDPTAVGVWLCLEAKHPQPSKVLPAVMLSKKDLASSFVQGRERVVSWNQVQKNLRVQFQPLRCKRSRPSRKRTLFFCLCIYVFLGCLHFAAQTHFVLFFFVLEQAGCLQPSSNRF